MFSFATVYSVAFVVVLVPGHRPRTRHQHNDASETLRPASLTSLGEATRRRQEVGIRGLDLRRGVRYLRRPRRPVVFSTPIIPY